MRRVNQIYLRRCMKLQRTMDVGIFGSNARGTFLFLPCPACWMESRRHIMTPPPPSLAPREAFTPTVKRAHPVDSLLLV